jgi:hypothetical protein
MPGRLVIMGLLIENMIPAKLRRKVENGHLRLKSLPGSSLLQKGVSSKQTIP